MKKKSSLFVILCFSMFLVGLSKAHSPSGINLGYDFDTDTLTVRVLHSVSDVNSHNIELIEIWVNDVFNQSEGYTSQTTVDYHEDSFIVPAVHNDVIKVKATCSISGSYQEEITIQDPAIPEFGIIFPIMFFVLVGLFVGWRLHKKHTNEN